MKYVKTCSKCGVEKSILEFRVSDRHKDGVHSQCNGCKKIVDAAYRDRNRERCRDRCRSWRARQKESRDAFQM